MKAPQAHWPTVAIVGLGMIGGSIALALKARKLVGRVIGVGRSAASLAEAKRLHAIDEAAHDAGDDDHHHDAEPDDQDREDHNGFAGEVAECQEKFTDGLRLG